MRKRALFYLVAAVVVVLLVVITLLLSMTASAPSTGSIFSNIVSELEEPTSAALAPTVTPTRATGAAASPLPGGLPMTPTLSDLLSSPSGGGAAPPSEEQEVTSAESTPTLFALTPVTGEDEGDEPGAAAPEDESILTPAETAVKIADATLLIRSQVSGNIIGDGTLQIFAPNDARYPEGALVRLELNLDNFYITPTPTGTRGTPVPRATSAATGIPTPGAPLLTDSGVPVYERMGASLFCSERSFDGCDQTYNLNRARLITTRHTTWEWTIFPRQDVAGLQNVRAELWITQLNLDGQPEIVALEGTQYSFQIEVNPAGGFPIWLPIGAAVVVIALAAGFLLTRRKSVPAAVSRTISQAKKPLVFISYRRGSSWAQARSIAQSLQQRGANVFIDVDDINEGRFAEIIETTINNCDYFVPILMPETLESEWVRREIRHALARDKIIIPLLAGGFQLESGVLPEDIREIASHNAITLLPEFYEEAINRLAERFLKL